MSIATNDHTAVLATVIENTTAIASGTVEAPAVLDLVTVVEAPIPIATIGHNSAPSDLPDAPTMHEMFLAAYLEVSLAHDRLDVATQRIAAMILMRHEVMSIGNPDALPLATIAHDYKRVMAVASTGGEASKYFDALVLEFQGADVLPSKSMTKEDGTRVLSRKAFRTRILRGFQLACCIAFNGGTFRDYDRDAKLFRTVPRLFSPIGYTAEPSLMFSGDAEDMKPIAHRFIGDPQMRSTFLVHKPDGSATPISLSIAQYIYATDTRIKAKVEGDAKVGEATPSRDRKAEAATKAEAKIAADAQKVADTAAAILQRAPTPPGSDARSQAVAAENNANALEAQSDALAAAALRDKATAEALRAEAAAKLATDAAAVANMSQTELGVTPTEPEAVDNQHTLIARLNLLGAELYRLMNHDQISTIGPRNLDKTANLGIGAFLTWVERTPETAAAA